MTVTDPSAQTGDTGDTGRADVDSGLVLLALQAQAADNRAPGWIKRRVEQLEFLDTRAVRWRVSIDFEVPREAPSAPESEGGYRLVPITTLPKGDLVAFDLRDENRMAMWMPTAEETNRRIAPAMVVRARRVLRCDTMPGTLDQDVMRIVAAAPRDHERAYRPFAAAAARIDEGIRRAELREASRNLRADPLWRVRKRRKAQRAWDRAQRVLVEAIEARRAADGLLDGIGEDVRAAAYELMSNTGFRSQIEELAQNYLVYVGLTGPAGTRRVIKLSSERTVDFWGRRSKWKRFIQSLGWRYWQVDVLLGGRGGSHHLEVAAPPGVDVVRIVARPTDPREHATTIRAAGFSPHVHVRIPRQSPVRYRAAIQVRVSRNGWLLASLLVGGLIAVVLGVGWLKLKVLFQTTSGGDEAGTAATLLLALLGVVASWLTRPGEHPLAARLLRLVRVLIMLDIAAVLAATGDLVVHRTTHQLPTPLWAGLTLASIALGLLLVLSWLIPRRPPWRSE